MVSKISLQRLSLRMMMKIGLKLNSKRQMFLIVSRWACKIKATHMVIKMCQQPRSLITLTIVTTKPMSSQGNNLTVLLWIRVECRRQSLLLSAKEELSKVSTNSLKREESSKIFSLTQRPLPKGMETQEVRHSRLSTVAFSQTKSK